MTFYGKRIKKYILLDKLQNFAINKTDTFNSAIVALRKLSAGFKLI